MLADMPVDELVDYRPAVTERADFDDFWQRSLAEARAFPLDARFEYLDNYLVTVDSYDVSFRGFGGHVVKGWLLVPKNVPRPPIIVEYLGYGAGRGPAPYEWLTYSAVGYAHLVMDSRGQGGESRGGDTPDIAAATSTFPGFTTLGVASPETYYYRRLFVDAVRAVEAVRGFPGVDPGNVSVAGMSQGGGIALAVAGLVPDLTAVMSAVPFLCHIERAIVVSDVTPYAEVTGYLRANPGQAERTLSTLSYFDGMNFATRATAPALFSVGLMDTVCPPSTVYAAYNHYAGPKQIRCWPYSGHDGARVHHVLEQLDFLAAHTGRN